MTNKPIDTEIHNRGIVMTSCFTRGILVLAIVLAAAGCMAAEAAVEYGPAEEQPAGTSTDWNSQLSVVYLPSATIHNTNNDAAIGDYRINLNRKIAIDNHYTLSLGAGYSLKQIDASSRASLPGELHGLYLEAGVTYRINDKAFASLKVYPGLYSDFKELGTDDVRMPALALSGYRFDNGLSVAGGFIYRFGYHSARFIPALGLSYQPNQYWRFDLMAPRPAITYFASRQLELFVAGDFASNEYELHDRSIGATAITYRDYKAMAGLNYLPVPAVKLSASAGYAFERKFLFHNTTRADLRMDDVPFFKVSMELGW